MLEARAGPRDRDPPAPRPSPAVVLSSPSVSTMNSPVISPWISVDSNTSGSAKMKNAVPLVPSGEQGRKPEPEIPVLPLHNPTPPFPQKVCKKCSSLAERWTGWGVRRPCLGSREFHVGDAGLVGALHELDAGLARADDGERAGGGGGGCGATRAEAAHGCGRGELGGNSGHFVRLIIYWLRRGAEMNRWLGS